MAAHKSGYAVVCAAWSKAWQPKRAPGQSLRVRYALAPPSVKRGIESAAFSLASKLNRERVCERCAGVTTIAQWPRDKSGTKNLHCGKCSGATAALDPTERRLRSVARKCRWRANRAALVGKEYRKIHEHRAHQARNAETAEARQEERKQQRLRRKESVLASLHCAHVTAYRGLSDRDYYRWRYSNDMEFNIKERLRRQFRKKSEAVPGMAELIRGALKRGTGSRTIESVLGYSIAQLKEHIERQFTKGMSWEVWGRDGIHIDHILPRKCFDTTTIEGVQAYWSLSNLRPLWAKANLQKHDRVEYLV